MLQSRSVGRQTPAGSVTSIVPAGTIRRFSSYPHDTETVPGASAWTVAVTPVGTWSPPCPTFRTAGSPEVLSTLRWTPSGCARTAEPDTLARPEAQVICTVSGTSSGVLGGVASSGGMLVDEVVDGVVLDDAVLGRLRSGGRQIHTSRRGSGNPPLVGRDPSSATATSPAVPVIRARLVPPGADGISIHASAATSNSAPPATSRNNDRSLPRNPDEVRPASKPGTSGRSRHRRSAASNTAPSG